MNIRLKILLPALGALLVATLLIHPPGARAETTAYCTEIAQADMPKTISTSGVYCVTENLSYSSTNAAIRITASDVVLDLNAHLLDGSSSSGAYGIYIGGTPRNVTIKNGTIRGFLLGVWSNSLSGNLIEDLTLDGNTGIGMYSNAEDSIIRNNRIINTGPTTGDTNAVGIQVYGSAGSRILNNDVIDTHGSGTGNAYGIHTDGCDNCFILDNRVSDTSSGSGAVITLSVVNSDNAVIEGNSIHGTSSSGSTYGLWSTGASGASDIVNNRVSGADTGYYMRLSDRYRDNIASNVTTGYSSGSDLGNND